MLIIGMSEGSGGRVFLFLQMQSTAIKYTIKYSTFVETWRNSDPSIPTSDQQQHEPIQSQVKRITPPSVIPVEDLRIPPLARLFFRVVVHRPGF